MAQVKQQTIMAKLDTDYIKGELFGGEKKVSLNSRLIIIY